MYKLALSLLSQSPNAEDNALEAVQMAFLCIISKYENIHFDFEEDILKAYLFSVVAHKAQNIRHGQRHYFAEIEYDDIPDDEDFVQQLCLNEKYEAVLRIVKELNDIYSIPLELRFVQDMSVKEIAAMLGIPEKTVYTRLERGKIIIIKRLKEEGFHD